MLTVEKDKECEQIFIHGTPDTLRWFAKKLETIANYAEKNGCAHDHLMTREWGGDELTSEIKGEKEFSAIIHHLIIYGWASNEN